MSKLICYGEKEVMKINQKYIIMTGNLSLKETLLLFGLPLFILVSLALFASSDIALSNSLISKSITLDLIITIPLIHWVLIRKKDISKFSVLSFFVIGVLIASFVIPEENQSFISFIKNWILPFIELGIVTIILLKIRKTIQVYRFTKNSSPDVFTILKKTCSNVFPKKNIRGISDGNCCVLLWIHFLKKENSKRK